MTTLLLLGLALVVLAVALIGVLLTTAGRTMAEIDREMVAQTAQEIRHED